MRLEYMDRPVRPTPTTLAFFAFFAAVCAVPAHASTATTLAGHAVTFSVTASGTSPFSYRWYKNGAAITGATGSTFAINSVMTGDAGVYYAVVANMAGITTSDMAVLTIDVAPVFTIQPRSLVAIPGTLVTFTASATGTPTPTYQWRRNGVAISGATLPVYTTVALVASTAVTYTVIATNAVGSATSSGAVLTAGTGTNSSSSAVITMSASVATLPGAPASSSPVSSSSVSLAASTLAVGGSPVSTPSGSLGASMLWGRAGPDPRSGDWRVIGVDSRPDGETDTLWQNVVTGQTELWVMDGLTLTDVISVEASSGL